MGVRLVFFFHLVNTHLEAILMSIYLLSMALNAALRAATQSISGKDFSRNLNLSASCCKNSGIKIFAVGIFSRNFPRKNR